MRNSLKGTSLFIGTVLLGIGLRCYAGDADVKLTTTDGSTGFTVQNANGVIVSSITSLGTVNFSSNTILPGTTFYQNGRVLLGTASQMVTISSVTLSSPTISGGLGLQSITVNQLFVPNVKGQIYYCSNCSVTLICVATGTATNFAVAGTTGTASVCH